MINVSDNIGIN